MSKEQIDILVQIQNHIVTAHCNIHDVKMDGSDYLRVKDAVDAMYKLVQKNGTMASWLPDTEALNKEATTQMHGLATNWEDDQEEAHVKADNILCKLLRKLGFDSVIDEYIKIDKWYA